MRTPVYVPVSVALLTAALALWPSPARAHDCNDKSFSGNIVCGGLGFDGAGRAISALFATSSDGRGHVSGIQKFWDGNSEQTLPFTGTYSVDGTCIGTATTTVGTFTFVVAEKKSVKFQSTVPGIVLTGDCQPSK